MIDGDTLVVGAYGQRGPYYQFSNTGAAYVFTRSGTSWSQQAKLQASDLQDNDQFGGIVVIEGDTVVAAARLEDTGGSQSGAVYVFTRSGTSWSQQAKVVASDAAAGDRFGQYVAIDSDTLVVGADGENSYAGAVYVFTRSGTSWSQQAKLVASDAAASAYFGNSVAIEGDTMVAGAYRSGAVDGVGAAYVFTRSGTSWSQQAKLVASDAAGLNYFGYRVVISNNTVVAGAYGQNSYAGAAYTFIAG